MENGGRVLCLDVGEVRIGVAVCDELRLFSHPLCSVQRRAGKDVAEIADILQREKAVTLVVGLPYELDGEIGAQAEKVRKFVRKLQGEFGRRGVQREITIIEWDERLSSRQAERVLAGSGLKDKKRKEALDQISATLILESFLAASK